MILPGRYGQVHYAPYIAPPGPPVFGLVASINAWKGDFKQDYEDVTCFGDENKVWIPGLPDKAGSFAGFWDSSELTLFAAAEATQPGSLKLVPNSNEPTFFWAGPAYLDASIDCSLKAPKITGTWKAAASWTGPDSAGSLAARRAA